MSQKVHFIEKNKYSYIMDDTTLTLHAGQFAPATINTGWAATIGWVVTTVVLPDGWAYIPWGCNPTGGLWEYGGGGPVKIADISTTKLFLNVWWQNIRRIAI